MKIYSKTFPVYLKNIKINDAEKLKLYLNQTNNELNFKINYNLNTVKLFIKNSRNLFINMFEFHFGVYKNKTCSFIGLFSIIHVNYIKKECEIGYLIANKYRRKKYGKSAIILLLYFIFNILKIKKVYAIVYNNSNNIASKKLLKKIHFKKSRNISSTLNNNYKFIADNKYKKTNQKFEAYVLLKKYFKNKIQIIIK